MAVTQAGDRQAFERLIAPTVRRPAGAAAIRGELARQTLFEPTPEREGLDELAALLEGRFAPGGGVGQEAVAEMQRAFPSAPLVCLYAFALHREAGRATMARTSLDALLEADPGDPMAQSLDAHLTSRATVVASERQRLENIARFASVPLLSNPYSLAVGVMFEAIRGRGRARVLDVGIGGGGQVVALLELLARGEHRLRRLEVVGLDFVPESLGVAGGRITAAAAALEGVTEVEYQPVEGRIQALAEADLAAVAGTGLDAANATIALHELPGESKLAALRVLRRLAPARLAVAEWNYCLENVLSETSTEYVFNVRSVAAAMVGALRERYTVADARAVVRDWLSQGAGQLTCPADRRQECFLQVEGWRALLGHCDFDVQPINEAWLAHAADPGHATVAAGGAHVETSHYGGAVPITLLVAAPASPARKRAFV